MGYQPLNPETLASSLQTVSFGKQLTHREEVSSTNVVAHELARGGCPEGTVVIAESQSAGKGRLGRSWESPVGKNLYLSLVLRPVTTPTEAAKLTLLAAVSVAETLHSELTFPPRIKWPNDILLRGRKTSGILCELVTEGERVTFVIVGVGVNLNYARAEMPQEIRGIATSVMEEAGRVVNRSAFTQRLIQSLETQYLSWQKNGFNDVARLWNQYARIEGQWMRAQVGGNNLVGKACGLDEHGFLVLESTKGITERVVAGDIFLLSGPPGAGKNEAPESDEVT